MAQKKPKLYAYARFSTPEQLKGDSLRRQTIKAKDYAERHGFELDTELTLQDLGVSAFRGKNAQAGALGIFLRAIEDGLIPQASCLYVEDEDRLSRQGFWEALPIFQLIINHGVSIGVDREDPLDRAVLNSSRGMFALNRLLMKLELAAEESRKKSDRIHKAWEDKRNRATEEPLTTRAPGWIQIDKTGEKEWSEPKLIPNRTKIVGRIFDEFLAGRGKEAIARGLNEDKVETFGRAARWHKSYVQKILNNPAVVGAYVPHEFRDGRRIPLDPIRDYYPKAITVETWKRARALLKSSGKTKARGGLVRNILAALAKCPKCGATMTRVMKGNGKKGGKPKLVCTAAKSGARDLDGTQFCTYTSVPLDAVEAALVWNADVFKRTVPARDPTLQADVEGYESELEVTLSQLENLLDVLSEKPSAAIENRVRKLEAKADELRAELGDLRAKAEQSSSKLVTNRAERLNKALSTEPVDIAAANAALRECFSHVVVDYDDGDLICNWRHTDQDLTIVYDPGFERLPDEN